MDSSGDPYDAVEGTGSYLDIAATDGDDAAITPSDWTTLTLTLYNKATADVGATVINSRTDVPIKAAGGALNVSISGTTIRVRLEAADNAVVDTTNIGVGEKETHVARINGTYSDGTATQPHREEHEFEVERVATPT